MLVRQHLRELGIADLRSPGLRTYFVRAMCSNKTVEKIFLSCRKEDAMVNSKSLANFYRNKVSASLSPSLIGLI